MDRLTQILLVAGLGCFAFAFALSAIYPWAITDRRVAEASIVELAQHVPAEFRALKDAYPVAFSTFPGSDAALTTRELADVPDDDPRRARSESAWTEAYAHALQNGRDRYVAEACWHCHSQYVRPVSNEAQRFGPVQSAAHDNNALQRPVLWGTRRVGPDLTHEGGLRSNDWHVAHFWDPQAVSPGSVMPRYTWFLDEGWQVRRRIDPEIAESRGLDPDTTYGLPGVYPTREEAEAAMARRREQMPTALADEVERWVVEPGLGPNATGLSVIAYLQWLGTWEPPAREESM